MTLKNILGRNILKYRKHKQITQERLAELVGIDQKSISKIENGNNYPTAENITAIANALGVDIYKLFLFSEPDIEKMKEEVIHSLNDEKNVLYLYQCLIAGRQ